MKSEATTIDDVGDGVLVVEAPTVEAALAAVTEQIGPDGIILGAEKVSRGGVGGFFAKETYRVSVRAPSPGVDLAPSPRPVADTPPVDVRAVVSDAAALVTTDDVDDVDVLDLRDGIDSSMAAVDRVLDQFDPYAGSAPTPSPSPAAPKPMPAPEPTVGAASAPTFGDALRAELQARAGGGVASPTSSTPTTTSAEPAMVNDGVSDRDRQHAAATYGSTAALAVPPASVALEPDRSPADFVATTEQAITERPATPDAPRAPLGAATDPLPGTGAVVWNADALSRLGLPFSLIRPLADLDSGDDLGWVYRLSELVAPLCGPLPSEELLLVGRHLDPMADALGVAVVQSQGQLPAPDVAIEIDLTERSRSFVDVARRDRRLHVFCAAAIETTPDDTAVVSFDEQHLGAALHLAIAANATMGYLCRDGELVRVTPFELALAVRARLARS